MDAIHANADALITRAINEQIRAAIAERIDLDAIAALAKKEVQKPLIDDGDLQSALDADTAAPWRDVVRQYADAAIDEQLINTVNHAVNAAIVITLRNMLGIAA